MATFKMPRPSDMPRKKVASKYWVRDFGNPEERQNTRKYNYETAVRVADSIGVLGAVYKDGTCTSPVYTGVAS